MKTQIGHSSFPKIFLGDSLVLFYSHAIWNEKAAKITRQYKIRIRLERVNEGGYGRLRKKIFRGPHYGPALKSPNKRAAMAAQRVLGAHAQPPLKQSINERLRPLKKVRHGRLRPLKEF